MHPFVNFQVLSTVSCELRIRGNEALLPDDKDVQGTSQVTCRIGPSDNPTSVTLGSRCKTALISGLRFVYLVDEDIDIRDQEALNWALSSCVTGAHDIHFAKSLEAFRSSFPSPSANDGNDSEPRPDVSSVASLSAIMKGVMPEISVADSSQMFKVLENWSETGLPRLAPRRRLEKFLKTIPPNSRLLVNASRPPDLRSLKPACR